MPRKFCSIRWRINVRHIVLDAVLRLHDQFSVDTNTPLYHSIWKIK